MKRILLFCLLCLWVEADEFKIKVGVSLSPYAFFVKKIGGDSVEIIKIVPPQRNPKFYEINYDQVRQIKNLKLLVIAGIPYEKKWIPRFERSHPSLRILKVDFGDCGSPICYDWLSFEGAKKIAKEIAYQLRVIDLKNAQYYKKNLELFLQELDEIYLQIQKELIASNHKKPVVDYQKVWQKLSVELGLEYALLEDTKQRRGIFCLITPFDPKKLIVSKYQISPKNLIELDPFREDWDGLIRDFIQFVSGEKNGK